MELTELEVGGHKYQIGRLPAMQQFHIARRLGPLLQAVEQIVATPETGGNVGYARLTPIINAVGKLSDEDSEYVIGLCLGVVKRHDAGKWMPVQARGSTRLMYADIDMTAMLQLTWATVQENLGDFFPGPAPASPPGT